MEDIKIGLWEKTSQKNVIYYSGKVKIDKKEFRVLLFKNEKQNEKQPDFNVIMKEEKKEENKENYLDDKVFADFGNQVADIKDEEIAF